MKLKRKHFNPAFWTRKIREKKVECMAEYSIKPSKIKSLMVGALCLAEILTYSTIIPSIDHKYRFNSREDVNESLGNICNSLLEKGYSLAEIDNVIRSEI